MDKHEYLDLRALPGSERTPAADARQEGTPLNADARVEATLVLRRRTELDDATLDLFVSRRELAVAPLWAALVARLAQATGRRFGLLQLALYHAVAPGPVPPGFRDVTAGSNGAFSAAKGWDPCTGLGVPDGTALLAALRAPKPPKA